MENIGGNLWADGTRIVLCCTVSADGVLTLWDSPYVRDKMAEQYREAPLNLSLTLEQLAEIRAAREGKA